MTIDSQALDNDIWMVKATGRLDQSQTPKLAAKLNAQV